jgi:cytochrome c-type biogenesis protein CcmH/NrfG
MIAVWLAFAIIFFLTVLYLAPALVGPVGEETDAELDAYFAQIDTIKTDNDLTEDEQAQAIAKLERQILAKQNDKSQQGASVPMTVFVFVSLLIIGSATYYTQSTPLGSHTIMAEGRAGPDQSISDSDIDYQNLDIDELLTLLEARLSSDRAEDTTAWIIYARTLIRLGRLDDGVKAYERALTLTDDSRLQEEFEQVQAFIREKEQGRATPITATLERGPTAADIEAAQMMSAEDQQAMINAMVSGLADRLAADPNDPAGWARLIRARLVMGQTEQAQIDVEKVQEIFSDDPEQVKDILLSAGWNTENP